MLTSVGFSFKGQNEYISILFRFNCFPVALDLCTFDSTLSLSSLGMFSHFSTVINKLPEVVDFVCCECVCMKCCDVGSLVSRRREQVWNDCSCFHRGQTKHFCKALEPLYSLKFSHLSFFHCVAFGTMQIFCQLFHYNYPLLFQSECLKLMNISSSLNHGCLDPVM